MSKYRFLLAFMILSIFFTLEAVYAQRGTTSSSNSDDDGISVRIASPLPRNSDWGRALDRLTADWKKATDNKVNAVVIHEGREGTEGDMIRKLYSNSIQVAVLTSGGMNDICPPVMTLSTPFLIKDNVELEAVIQNVQPYLESRVKNEFIVLAWSKGGWVYVFTKEKVLTPDDLRRQKLGTSPELGSMNTVFRTLGFNLVEADVIDIGKKIASNMVNSIYMIPTAIVPMQLHKNLGHMLDLPIAPIMGALVMNRVTWNKLTMKQQQDILKATRQMAVEFDISMAKTEASALQTMSKGGLKVNVPTPGEKKIWLDDIQKAMPSLVGSVFDRELYNKINDILEKTRSGR